MLNSAIFLFSGIAAGLMTAAEVWDGSNWITTLGLAIVGGVIMGGVIQFLAGTFMKMAKARDWW